MYFGLIWKLIEHVGLIIPHPISFHLFTTHSNLLQFNGVAKALQVTSTVLEYFGMVHALGLVLNLVLKDCQ